MLPVLIASVLMLSIFGAHNALADTPIDTTDYFGPALKIFNQQQKISLEASGLQQQIADLNASSTANTSVINSRIVLLKQQLDADNKQIDDMSKEIKRLETLNIKSYQVDPQTEKKLRDAEKAIHDKYIGNNESPYSDNPVQVVYADFKHRTIVVTLDPNQVKGSPESLAAKIIGSNGESITIHLDAKTLQSVEPTGDVPIDIKYGKTMPATCTSRTQICTPLVGGVSISNIAVHTLNTIGYRAFLGQTAGFVIAGHTATESNTIVQPYTSNNVIGTVQVKGPICDCAFVADSQQTQDNVFVNGVMQYAISANVPSSQQPAGGFVYKSGAATGFTMGTITNNPPPGSNIRIVTMTSGGGDSGSPVIANLNGSTASLYGMVFGINGDTTQYYAEDYINSQLNVIPS